jgi:hypothetical protein
VARHEIDRGPQFAVLEGLGLLYLKQFIELFPKSPLALMLRGYFTYSRTVLDDEDSTEELVMTVDGDPYDIILASALIMARKMSLTCLFRTPSQPSRTRHWRT